MIWQDFARCKGADDSIFFDSWKIEEALTYCDDCPVRGFCRAEGVRTRSFGMWGGVSYSARSNDVAPHNPVVIRWD